ncbi:MAG: hypothetical protein JNJ60_22660, partial [Rhodocyclaceae bacterium]|nr:hypothetical protein [Rhodocyclaceae bacterium]
ESGVGGEADAAGKYNFTPVGAVTLVDTTTKARVGTGALTTISGKLDVLADYEGHVSSFAKGATTGTNLAIGASLGLNISDENTSAELARSFAAGGDITVQSVSLTDDVALATASTVGAEEEQSGGKDSSGKTADEKAASQRTGAETARTENAADGTAGGNGTSANPQGKTNEGGQNSGAISVAAAIAVNVAEVSVGAVLVGSAGTPITVTSGGNVVVRSKGNASAGSRADGSALTTKTGTSVGAAIALTRSIVDSQALIEHANVTGGGVSVDAAMEQRKVDIDNAQGASVDLDEDTIYIGVDAAAKFTTGDEVSYDNGGGTSIGGLTDDNGSTKYYVIVGEDGKIKLAASADDATAGKAIDLTSLGSGDTHKIDSSDDSKDATFDPDKLPDL